MQITLPDGYEWKFDASCGCITIYKTTGISNAGVEDRTVVKTYDATGRRTGEDRKGLNIHQMDDGTVRKVMQK